MFPAQSEHAGALADVTSFDLGNHGIRIFNFYFADETVEFRESYSFRW